MVLEIKKYPMYSAGVKQPYSRSVVVGNMVFCAGMDGRSPETGRVISNIVAEQTAAAMDKVSDALKEAGTSLDNIVRTVILLKNMEDYEHVQEALRKYYQKHAPLLLDEPPASKVIQYHYHVQPDSLVEIEVIAVLSRDEPGWEVKKYPMYCAGVKQPYSKSVVVGNLIYLSGMDGRSLETGRVISNNVADQVETALDNIKVALRETGTTMDNIVDTVMLLTNLDNYACMRETEAEYLQSHARRLVNEPPASTFIKTASLAKPECLVEIQATAVVSQDQPGWKVIKYPEWCAGKRLVICGDLNTAHKEIDLARPKENSKVSGFLPEERALMDRFVSHGYVDTFRHFNKEPDQYTWWDMKSGARERNVGWRLDYFFVSEDLLPSVTQAFIMSEIMGSDHCPVGLILKTP